MPLYKKSILKVGTYHSPDGTVKVTPQRLKHWARMHRKLTTNSQVVPVDWDHADDPTAAVPMSVDKFASRKRSAKNTVGHLKGFKVAEDGQSAEITLDIHRKSAAEAADANSVFVSPVIFDRWKDGAGNEYDDVITHVDFVNHPVDGSQGSFEAVGAGAVACALRFGLDSGKPSVYRFELDDDEDDDEDDDTDSKDGDTDDDSDDDSDVNVDVDLDDDEVDDDLIPDDIVEMGDDPLTNAPVADMAADETLAQQIAADLEAAGIAPPEGVNPISQAKEFLAQLCAALRQKAMDAANKDGGDDGADDAGQLDDASGQEGDLVETAPEFAAMSLARKRDKARIEALEQRCIKQERETRLADLQGLLTSGRITSDEFNHHCKQVNSVRMSLGKDGAAAATDTDVFIASRRSVPEGTMWPADSTLRLSLQTTEPPSDFSTAVTPEEAKKYVDEQAQRMPGMLQPTK